jgi:hypothetical protein
MRFRSVPKIEDELVAGGGIYRSGLSDGMTLEYAGAEVPRCGGISAMCEGSCPRLSLFQVEEHK